jgi:cyclopropane fatty-acyl-phospholipid synthase-like methyltransferase
MSFIDHHEDIARLGERRVFLKRDTLSIGRQSRQLLELLNGRHHRLTRRMLQDLPEVFDAVRALGVREAAVTEGIVDLFIQLRAVGHHDDGGMLLAFVTTELQREPEHRERLSRSLRMPDDTASRSGLLRRLDAVHRPAHGHVLLVAAHLADSSPTINIEDHEVPHDVEEVLRFHQTV